MANIKEAGHFTLTFTFDDQDPELRFFNGTYDGTSQNVHIGATKSDEQAAGNANIHNAYYDIDWTNESNLANYFVSQNNTNDNSEFKDDRDFLRNNYSYYNSGTGKFSNEEDNVNTDVHILNNKEHNDHRLTTDLIGGYSQQDEINPGTGTIRNLNLLGEHFNRNVPSKNNKSFINELSPFLIAVRAPENQGNEYYCDKNDNSKGYQFAWLNGATMWTFPISQEHSEGVDVTKHVFYRADHPQKVDKNRLRTYCYSDWQWGSETSRKSKYTKSNSKIDDALMKNARVTWLGSADAPKYDTSLPEKPVTIEQIDRPDGNVGTISVSEQVGPVHLVSAGHTTQYANENMKVNGGDYDAAKQSWGTRKANITVSFNSKTVSENYARMSPTETTISNLKVTVFIHYYRRHDYSPLQYSEFETKTEDKRGYNGTKMPKSVVWAKGSAPFGDGTQSSYSASQVSWAGHTNTLIKGYRFRSIARFIELGTVPFTHMAQSIMSTNGKILLKELLRNKNNKLIDHVSIESNALYKKGVTIGPKNTSEQEVEAEVLGNANLFNNGSLNTINSENAYKGDSEQLVLEPKNCSEKWIIQSHDVCNTDGNRYNRLYFKFDEDGIYPRYNMHSSQLRGNEQTIRPTQNRTDVPYGAVAYIRSNPSNDNTASSSVGADKNTNPTINALLNFTGQHRSVSDLVDENPVIGNIVVSSGKISTYTSTGTKVKGKSAITINESVPEVEYSSESQQSSAFGVIAGLEDESDIREYEMGSFVSVYKKSTKDRRLIVNSLGEGAIWVCDENGNLNNGDCITTSNLEGLGMKQDDDIIHNYTVAKITIDCTFNINSSAYECLEVNENGQKYKKAFVPCTYHCG